MIVSTLPRTWSRNAGVERLEVGQLLGGQQSATARPSGRVGTGRGRGRSRRRRTRRRRRSRAGAARGLRSRTPATCLRSWKIAAPSSFAVSGLRELLRLNTTTAPVLIAPAAGRSVGRGRPSGRSSGPCSPSTRSASRLRSPARSRLSRSVSDGERNARAVRPCLVVFDLAADRARAVRGRAARRPSCRSGSSLTCVEGDQTLSR